MIAVEVLELLRQESSFITSPIHGLKHWRTVERNGHYLANFNGADKAVLSYFAYFHDCMRENEGRDKGHGPRAASFAKKHRDSIPLNDVQFKQLTDACKGHTYGTRPDCTTINTCWDADRLDLGRVGISPDASYLHDIEAKRIANEFDFDVLNQFKAADNPKQGINKVVFDLDNTLICEKGESVRSGMFELLDSLKANGAKHYDQKGAFWVNKIVDYEGNLIKVLSSNNKNWSCVPLKTIASGNNPKMQMDVKNTN